MDTARENPPSSINTDEKLRLYEATYDEITKNGVDIDFQGRHALADLVVMFLDRDNLMVELEKGEVIEMATSSGLIEKKNPARTSIEKLRSQILMYYKEFRMTPVSAGTRKGASIGNESDGFDGV